MSNKTKTEKLLNALQNGSEISVAQAITRFSFAGPSSVTSAVRNLREQGHSVYANKVNNITKYRIGTPTRVAVATAYAVRGADLYRN